MQPAPSSLRVEDLATTNEAMARCLRLAALAAKSDVPVVLLGETGTGKTLLAHAIHNSSTRAARMNYEWRGQATSCRCRFHRAKQLARLILRRAQPNEGNEPWPR